MVLTRAHCIHFVGMCRFFLTLDKIDIKVVLCLAHSKLSENKIFIVNNLLILHILFKQKLESNYEI